MRISRRRFFKTGLIAGPLCLGRPFVEASCVEPEWLKVERIRLREGGHKTVHFTDLHFRGDAAYLQRVVEMINAEKPDIVCFTGDVVEEAKYFAPALEILQNIKAPLYGIPGNHDFWANADFDLARKKFSAQGGRWLMDESAVAASGLLTLHGVTGGKQ